MFILVNHDAGNLFLNDFAKKAIVFKM